MYALYDFCNEFGDNLIVKWAHSERLSGRDKALLDVKCNALSTHGTDLIPKLLAPVSRHPGIFKLRAQTTRALRPMLCKGPLQMEGEFTLLLGSIEENFVLRPPPAEATKRKNELLKNAKRRVEHERFG